MRKLLVIGIGTGNPEHMTVQAVSAVNRADVVLIPRKGEAKDDLAEVRRQICARFVTNPETRIVEFDLPVRDQSGDYRKGVHDWHQAIATTYRDLLQAETNEEGAAAFLVWGDPSLYDSTLRIIERLKGLAPFDLSIEVIPGITSIQQLCASHRIPLNKIGDPVVVTTGRQLRDGFPAGVDTAVVMLDGECSFQHLEASAFTIFWGAYLGTKDEILVEGPLSAVGSEIVAVREAARAKHGWIMDTYLLLRRSNS
ncbi:precorrin-6A synthase (deacetylating) [Tianweitania sediminis]|jgi:precorrin-6A synthase|uniref:Precorrin-6A synthase [deacetylating] n=1 Tax=Tianweitania sediminis TaxID=1502156 RepID=A0A8J7ULR6_9HYPH|nr:precorrin-6A synthase (deacetylating) [Tianweitania sediminis]MBP0441029.1 precorrin-6A synthase (deacetylating) [Tianweitania sediminis]HEV7417487.1 precorrin-6A synthase (deacetylating) [Tianweitania sediminis]